LVAARYSAPRHHRRPRYYLHHQVKEPVVLEVQVVRVALLE
jgi:hypothetical protein